MDKQTKSEVVLVRLSGQEKFMLEKICEKFGAKAPEYIRSVIREKFQRAFPAYTTKKNEALIEESQQLTPEQACEQAGGRIETVNGIQVCIFKLSKSMEANVPLSTPELFKKYKKS